MIDLRTRVRGGVLRWLGVGILTLLAGCTLPPLRDRASTFAITATADTALGRAIAADLAGHPGRSGIYLMRSGRDAFAARALLTNAAQRSIDAQYYIWRDDDTGILLLEALWRAAERGVRVRLLLDDHGTRGLDPTIAAMASNKNIEVRLFNPLSHRRARWLNYLFDFKRLNHRMHNKSFTIDNQVAVVGGRNIGDEYFDTGGPDSFDDLDLIAVGPVVSEVSKEFDLFWNSASAYPAELLLHAASSAAGEQLMETFHATDEKADSIQYLKALHDTPLVEELRGHHLEMEWTRARVVYDDPAKVFDEHREDLLLMSRLLSLAAPPRSQFDLVTPYFVPGKPGTRRLANLTQGDVQIRILTNSLESTDASVVHAGYLKHRKRLLRSGVQLYERERNPRSSRNKKPHGTHFAATSLHAKTFQIDDRTLFVGSFNFDQRSAHLNTEMGVIVDDSLLAKRVSDYFDSQVSSEAYDLKLDQKGHIEWIQRTAAGSVVYHHDPGTSLWRRAKVRTLSVLPIDWLL